MGFTTYLLDEINCMIILCWYQQYWKLTKLAWQDKALHPVPGRCKIGNQKKTLPSLPFLRLANFDILKSLNLPLRLGGIKQKNLSLILNVINLFVLFSLASGSKPLVTILLCWSCSGVGLAIHIINNENALKISRKLF